MNRLNRSVIYICSTNTEDPITRYSLAVDLIIFLRSVDYLVEIMARPIMHETRLQIFHQRL
jgi:hypothetical protein